MTEPEPDEHGYGLPDVPRFQPELVARGAALGLAGLVSAGLGLRVARSAGLIGVPIALAGLVAGFLFAWAAAIHLSGGERFDDHPFL